MGATLTKPEVLYVARTGSMKNFKQQAQSRSTWQGGTAT
jgi:hypothetical protein